MEDVTVHAGYEFLGNIDDNGTLIVSNIYWILENEM